MIQLKKEIEENFLRFQATLNEEYSRAYDSLSCNQTEYLGSYERLSSLEAWRAYLLEQIISPDVLKFFVEAQNDTLLSHTFARIGVWRSSLQSLRCALDNILFFLYYKDHSIEYQLWERGKHQLPISDFQNYLDKHPKCIGVAGNITGLALLKSEYPTLSKAVHGSSATFRMTTSADSFPVLMMPDVPKLNQWITRERKVIQLINQLLLAVFSDHLHGASLRNLRKSISLVIPSNLYDDINSAFNVRLLTT